MVAQGILWLRLIGLAAVPTRQAGQEHVLERKDAALLAMLAIDGPTARARLSVMLWPDAAPRAARGNLRQRLFRLRAAIGREVVQAAAANTLRLADEVTLDITDVHRQLRDDPQAGLGQLLADHDYGDLEELEQWVSAARERWHAAMLAVLAQVAGEHESRRKIDAALPYAHRLLAEDPLAEEAHRRLMRLHYLRGDRAAAMTAYRHCCTVLAQELSLQPSDETLSLARTIEANAAKAEAVPASRPVVLLRPPRMVGRSSQRETARRKLARGTAVLVVGEAGIGKSRFIEECCDNGIVCAARAGDARWPYALAARLVHQLAQQFHSVALPDWSRAELARIAPALGEAAAGALSILHLKQALGEAVQRWQEAGLAQLAIDDLHFADEASLELLPVIVDSLRTAGAACMLAQRGAEMSAPLAEWLATQEARAMHRIALEPLDRAAVCELLSSLALADLDAEAWCDPLTGHTGGNPLFILETLMALVDADAMVLAQAPAGLPEPPQVGALIERRLGLLSPHALKLARLAAIAGDDFGVALAAHVLKAHPLDIANQWSELEAACVIRDESFAHDLVREAALRSVPHAIALAMHRDVAAYLQDAGDRPERVAAHWASARQWMEAGICFDDAARRAHATSQRWLEADLARQSADCFARAGDKPREFAARERRFRASRYVDTYAVQVDRAHELARLATNDSQTAGALEARAMVATDDQQDDTALAAAREAGALARALGDTSRELSVARLEARALSRLNRQSEAIELLLRCREPAWSRTEDELGAQVLMALGATLIICDRLAEASPLLLRAIDLATSLQDWEVCYEAMINLAWCRCCQGHLAESTADYEQAHALRDRFVQVTAIVSVDDVALARQYKELGRFAEALQLLGDVLNLQRRSENFTLVAVAESEMVSLWLSLGQPARAQQALRPPSEKASPTARAAAVLARARLALALGRPAVGLLHEAGELVEREGRAYYRLVIQNELARLLAPDEALQLLRPALAQSEALDLPIVTWPLKSATCDALCRGGHIAEAATLAREIVREFEGKPPITRYAPEYWWIARQALLAAGDTSAADGALCRAHTWITQTALPNVPPAFRHGFVHRHPVNAAVMAATAAARA